VQARGGHAEATRRFRLKGRQFELQIAFASPDPSAAVLRQINTLLRSLEVGAIATPPAAAPARPLQRGSGDGVEVEVHRSGLVTFHFDTTSELYRRLQGRPLALGCLDFDSTDPWEPNQWSTSTKTLAATVSIVINDATRPRPPYATLEPATEARPPLAGCYVGGSQGRRWNDPRAQRAAAEIALTEAGRRFFDERAVARDLALFVRSPKLKAVRRAAKRGADAPSAASIRSGLPPRVVTQRERRQPTAAGEIGIWSDRGILIEVSARSATGKRLFIQLRDGRIGDHNLGMLAFVF